MNDNLKEALRLAGLAYRVYPAWGCRPDGTCLCGGMAGCKPGKHPWGKMVPHGGKDATTDRDTLTAWFPGPGVNVGVRVDAFMILDVEARGLPLLAEWERTHGPMPVTPTAISGGGGRHYYFTAHPAIVALNPKEKVPVAAGAELLTGGDVIAPPSSHKLGGRYSWLVPPETPRADMPTWLVALVTANINASTHDKGYADDFDPMTAVITAGMTFDDLGQLPSGKRNAPVNEVIGSMLGNGYSRQAILTAGLKWAADQTPEYSEADLRAKVESFARKQGIQIDEITNDDDDVVRNSSFVSPTNDESASSEHSSIRNSFVRNEPPDEPASKDGDSSIRNSSIRNGSQDDEPTGSQVDTPPPVSQSYSLSDDAYYGILGEYVRTVERLTEADPAGILACLLTGVGNILGRQVHHRIGRRHSGNLFMLLVGPTSSRKGTCWDAAEALLTPAQADWHTSCLEGGFGSGQGVVWRIRDGLPDDPGIPDKRLLVVEEEFSKPLRLARQDTSTLSPIIRSAFDGSPLSVLNRGENRYAVREPHVSVIGMTTADELLAGLRKSPHEVFNGFLNRFLLVGVQRRRYLPCGGDYYGVAERFAPRLQAALDAVKPSGPLTLSPEATALWEGEYRRLEGLADRGGVIGPATARLSVHALKLALVYAALDGSAAIGLPHLRAALALVDYADRTAQAVFGGMRPDGGGSPDDPPADEPPHTKLLMFARGRPDGITRTDASNLFSRNRKAADLASDFDLLTRFGFGRWVNGRWYDVEHVPADGPTADSPTGGGGVDPYSSPDGPTNETNYEFTNNPSDATGPPDPGDERNERTNYEFTNNGPTAFVREPVTNYEFTNEDMSIRNSSFVPTNETNETNERPADPFVNSSFVIRNQDDGSLCNLVNPPPPVIPPADDSPPGYLEHAFGLPIPEVRFL